MICLQTDIRLRHQNIITAADSSQPQFQCTKPGMCLFDVGFDFFLIECLKPRQYALYPCLDQCSQMRPFLTTNSIPE